MYYYVTKYSFDPDKPVCGPFKTESDAWKAMEAHANEECRIDTEENQWDAHIFKDRENGEITLVDYFVSHKDTTEFFIIEINNTKLI